MHKGKLHELLKEIRHLTDTGCHTEARIMLAVCFNRFKEAKILMSVDHVQDLEKELPRQLSVYRDLLTERLLRHIQDSEGHEVAEKCLRALMIKERF